MKHSGKLFLGLILVTWLVVQVWKPTARTNSIPTDSTRHPHDASFSPTAAIPHSKAVERSAPSEVSAEKIPAFEGSWAKELRQLKELAAKDPDTALSRVTQMADKHEQRAAAKEVCLTVAEKDPAKAMTAAWNLELGKLNDESAENETLEYLAKAWASTDLMKAFAWASALPDDEESRRDRIIKGIAAAVSQIKPATAARLVTEQMSADSQVQVEAAMDVLRQWAARDYAGAIAWAAHFPTGPMRERGIEELASVGPNQPSPKTKPN